MLITAIEPRKRGFSVLYFEDDSSLRILTEIVLAENLRPGRDIPEEEMEELFKRSRAKRAGEKALTLLEYRSYSKKELEDRLSRESGREAAKEAADRMEELGLLDDEDYARRLAEDLITRKGFSKSRVRQELCRRGLEKELAESAAEEFSRPPVEAIREIVERKYARYLGDEKGRRRAIAALQRLGYRYEDIRVVLREYPEYTEDKDEEECPVPWE